VAVLADPVFSADDARVKAYLKAANLESAPSVHDLANRPELQVATEVVTGSSKPRSPPVVLRRLLYTRVEGDAIMKLVQGDDGLEAVDFKANRALALSGALRDFRILHFATHALIDNEHPDLSAIALSGVNERGEVQDGFLRAREIFNLKLSADLVVLSACRSGTGKDVAGEGLFGLTRPFMYAGARTVIVSLWSLDDRATAELMGRFYEQLLGPNKLSPAAALRAAKIGMWRESRWRSPYFWGAFQLQRDWR
jgi:CHAT domain-containing protein